MPDMSGGKSSISLLGTDQQPHVGSACTQWRSPAETQLSAMAFQVARLRPTWSPDSMNVFTRRDYTPNRRNLPLDANSRACASVPTYRKASLGSSSTSPSMMLRQPSRVSRKETEQPCHPVSDSAV